MIIAVSLINAAMDYAVLNILITIKIYNNIAWSQAQFIIINNFTIVQYVCQEELCYNIIIIIQIVQLQLHQLIHNISSTIIA